MVASSSHSQLDPTSSKIGSPSFPAPVSHSEPHPTEALDRAAADLKANKRAWAELPIRQRISLLEAVQDTYAAVAERWVAACVEAKGLRPGTFAEGEEWIIFVMGMRALNHLKVSLEGIEKTGRPPIPGGLRTDAAGRVVARVFPAHWSDRLLYRGITADVWMAEGTTVEAVKADQAWAYHQPSDGQIALVLAAGNLSILPLLDSLDRLFVKKQVVLLKTNPVSDYMDPILADALRPLIEAGFLRMVRGGAAEGRYLTRHEAVDSIHMTGSDKTFRRIVFGEDGANTDGRPEDPLTKEITAELGNVTPLIIVPGPWTRDDIRHKAIQVASWMAINASFNCLSPRIIVQHAGWPLRDAFLTELENVLANTPPRKAYYPGAKQRQERFVEGHADVRQLGQAEGEQLPWTLIRNVNPDNQDDMAFRSEVFCSVLSETALNADSPIEFIERAVEFANRQLWGTLIVSLFVHPRSLADPEIGAAIEGAIADLRYGTVCLNLRGEYGYYPLLSPWGGAPGSPLNDVQSGLGVINNPLMFKTSQKSIVRGPFRQWPDPFLVTANHTLGFGKALYEFERRHSLTKLPKVLWSALRG